MRYELNKRFSIQQVVTSHMPDGMTNNELARRSGVSKGTISRICSGKLENPSIHTVQPIAGALHLSVSELIGEVQAPKVRRETIERLHKQLEAVRAELNKRIMSTSKDEVTFQPTIDDWQV